MSKKSIPLSKKYGVNPTIPLCFWCGQEKNEIVLLGKLKGDAEAPRSTWILGDYEPCDKCKEYRSKGITLIEANAFPMVEKQPDYLQKGAYPTGNYMVIKEDAVRRIFDAEIAEKIIEKKLCLIDSETFEILNGRKKSE